MSKSSAKSRRQQFVIFLINLATLFMAVVLFGVMIAFTIALFTYTVVSIGFVVAVIFAAVAGLSILAMLIRFCQAIRKDWVKSK